MLWTLDLGLWAAKLSPLSLCAVGKLCDVQRLGYPWKSQPQQFPNARATSLFWQSWGNTSPPCKRLEEELVSQSYGHAHVKQKNCLPHIPAIGSSCHIAELLTVRQLWDSCAAQQTLQSLGGLVSALATACHCATDCGLRTVGFT